MTAAFGTGWPGIDLRWRPGRFGTVFPGGNVRRRKRERNAARGVVADEAWRNREVRLPLVDWGPAKRGGRRGLITERGSVHMSRRKERRVRNPYPRLFAPP